HTVTRHGTGHAALLRNGRLCPGDEKEKDGEQGTIQVTDTAGRGIWPSVRYRRTAAIDSNGTLSRSARYDHA
ncbi:MAG: hypothetical protein KDA96_28595, partial [Planctomycetaceae bacterium]|nr:hypothetical protein [Planctomycetaceae bacterium]